MTSRALAVFACIPPTESAIGKYTWASFRSSERPVHYFSMYERYPDWAAAQSELESVANENRLFHVDTFAEALDRYGYTDALYVLGNSGHHHFVVKSLIRNAQLHSVRRHVHLHEAQVTYGLIPALGNREEALETLYRSLYPEFPDDGSGLAGMIRRGCHGLRALAALGDPHSIIVNSSYSRTLVEKEIAGRVKSVRVFSAFLPLKSDVPIRPKVVDLRRLKIGSFGIPHEVKHLDILVAAVGEMVASGQQAELILAGPSVRAFLAERDQLKPFVQAIDSPSDAQMNELMESIDVGIQLRWPTHGESSASVNELIALGKRVVLTDTGSFKDLSDFATLTPVGVSPQDLARAIRAAAVSTPDTESFIRRYSARNFRETLQRIMESL